MDSFLIKGGIPLRGTVRVSGSKNSALPILAACIMAEGVTTLREVPQLPDVDTMLKLLGELGLHARRYDDGRLDLYVIDERDCEARYDIVKTMRASICVLGPLLARRGKAIVSIPDGCAVGDRPVDVHVRCLVRLGAEFHTENGNLVGTAKGGLKGCGRMYVGGAQGPTVLGTINIMSAASLAKGTTVIVGAACDPEVADCAALLNKMGARIAGAGTPEIHIEGVEALSGCDHTVISDRIEAATFMIAAAITNGEVGLTNVNLDHLTAVIDRLEEVGLLFTCRHGGVRVTCPIRPRPIKVSTQPYPGFPTDVQSQLMALLTMADGNSAIVERVFPYRFLHVGELNQMGARIQKLLHLATITGVKRLVGTTVMATDLRASAALVLAGLAARGMTRVDRVYHIDRGYEKFEEKLRQLGADIQRVADPVPSLK